MEQAITQTKEKRSRAKSKLTSIANQFGKPLSPSELHRLHSQLEEAHSAFLDLHYEYSEYVLSDDKYADQRIVSNLSLDDYVAQANSTYKQAIKLFSTAISKPLVRDVNLAIKKADIILEQQNRVTPEQYSDYYDQVNEHVGVCRELRSHFSIHSIDDSDSIMSALEDFILKLECIQIRHTGMGTSRSVHFDNMSAHIQLSSQSTNMQSSNPSSSRDGTGITDGGAARSAAAVLGGGDSGPHESTRLSLGRQSSSLLAQNTNISRPYMPRSLTDDLSIVSLYANDNFTQAGTGSSNEHEEHNTTPHDNRCLSRFKFNKTPLPTFNGDRKLYSEFRSIWRMHAQAEFRNDQERAWELKQCLKGEALDCVRAVPTNSPNAYNLIWHRLDNKYCDVSLNVQSIYDELKRLTPVKEGDLRGLVKFVNQVELCYSRLGALGQIDYITMIEVDDLNDLLPSLFRWEWMERHRRAGVEDQLHPFPAFMRFLEDKRDVAMRFAERPDSSKISGSKFKKASSNAANVDIENKIDRKPVTCLIHPESEHSLINCRKFLSLSVDEKYNVLKSDHLCFRCLKKHARNKCKATKCITCGKNNHHSLLCRLKYNDKSEGPSFTHMAQSNPTDTVSASSNHNHAGASLLPIQKVPAYHPSQMLTVFFDGGSNASFITHRAAKLSHARRLKSVQLDLTTTGNVESQHDTCMYEINLRSQKGTQVPVKAYGLSQITGYVGELNEDAVSRLFPGVDVRRIQRSGHVDLLIGSDYCSLHPRREVAKAGENLCVLEGPLGQCIQGTHPDLPDLHCPVAAQMTCTVLSTYISSSLQIDDHVEFASPSAHFNRAEESKLARFIEGENLGTELAIKCGGCKCNKCPTPGHSYSFTEEQQLRMIRQNLKYDEDNSCWRTTYPWIVDPSQLPNNYQSAVATLQSTERTLHRDPNWAKIYSDQINDMVERQVARKLTTEELSQWTGPQFYISHLAVQNPKSSSTPVRIVFNSSQLFRGISLNSCLAKGPDAYINNILGVLIRWREGRVALVADIRKMYNSIHIEPVEQHCHRFLWRNLESRQPDIYVITRVNMGDKPAAAISAEAIYMTADMFAEEHPDVALLLKTSTYVDDIVYSVSSKSEAYKLAQSTTKVLKAAGFAIKHWLFSGESEPRINLEVVPTSNDPDYQTHVLGVGWKPLEDQLVTEVKLNFSPKKKGVYTKPNLTIQDVPKQIPSVLTRRMVLEQTMKVYDPLGIFTAFTLRAKILLRQTWERELGWDDPLPSDLKRSWDCYFTDSFQLAELKFDRSLTPPDATGDPILVLLSDASDDAYGFVAYIRWALEDGTFWCRFIMAKCRIAPVRQLSTPKMELNAAVLSKRGRKVIESESRFNFQRVYHLIDSETVLCSINKTSTRHPVFEGVRIAEIQSATDGNMKDWYWVKGSLNTADWLTRGKQPSELGPHSEWWNGPAFLSKPEEEWEIKSYAECVGASCSSTQANPVEDFSPCKFGPSLVNYSAFSSVERLIWTVARVYSSLKHRRFYGGKTEYITPQCLQFAKVWLIKDIQQSMLDDLSKRKGGRYSKLSPVMDSRGLWCVGKRLSRHNPMTVFPSDLQILLPNKHHLTELFLKQAHIDGGHRGRDATLARFRQTFWITQGSKVTQKVINSCQLCRLRDATFLSQEMGVLPVERLKPQPPFNKVMVDLFGPYRVRGEVQKRTSGKVYGIIFTDLYSRAVHIEAAFGYDTDSFLQALRRFSNIRGWPSTIFSDPGSQLVGAEKELISAWQNLNRESLYRICSDQGTEWQFSPADSAWRQGAVESLIKSAKRAIKFSIHDQRLSPSEFMTLCSEISSILNERPLGVLPSSDSSINILTPNCQLIGRPFCRNPGGWQESSLRTRLRLIDTILKEFWSKWTELYAPSLVRQGKWRTRSRNLQPGDVVVVADAGALRGNYYIAQVHEVFPSRDGVVRKVSIRYKNFRIGEKLHEYQGSKDVIVHRSVQKLALLVPVCEGSPGG